jgi:hypothetical protein
MIKQWSEELITSLRTFVNYGMAVSPGDIDISFVTLPDYRDVCPMQ